MTEHQSTNSTKANTSVEDDIAPTSPMDDQLWQDLATDWQAQPVSETDIKALLKETKRRTRWAKILLALDIIGSIVVFLGCLYEFLREDPDFYVQVYLSIASVGCVFYLYFAMKIRLSAWQSMQGAPDNAVRNAMKGIISSIKYIKVINWSLAILLPLGNWFIYSVATDVEKSPWAGLTIFNVIMLVGFGITEYFRRQRVQELTRFSSNISE